MCQDLSLKGFDEAFSIYNKWSNNHEWSDTDLLILGFLVKPYHTSNDQWDEVDLLNPTETEHKPNVHLAQSSCSINWTHLRYSEKSNPIVRRC